MAELVDATDLKSVDLKCHPGSIPGEGTTTWSQYMKLVGSRRARGIHLKPTGESLAEGARFNEAISWLSQSTFVPKGVYRFASHMAANEHAEDCVVQGMARLAKRRAIRADNE